MKEQKPLRPGSAAQSQSREKSTEDNSLKRGLAEQRSSGSTEQEPRPGSTMRIETDIRRTRGRLSRDVQAKLGKTLQAYFDDVVKQGVPDRFKELLQQIDKRTDKEST